MNIYHFLTETPLPALKYQIRLIAKRAEATDPEKKLHKRDYIERLPRIQDVIQHEISHLRAAQRKFAVGRA